MLEKAQTRFRFAVRRMEIQADAIDKDMRKLGVDHLDDIFAFYCWDEVIDEFRLAREGLIYEYEIIAQAIDAAIASFEEFKRGVFHGLSEDARSQEGSE